MEVHRFVPVIDCSRLRVSFVSIQPLKSDQCSLVVSLTALDALTATTIRDLCYSVLFSNVSEVLTSVRAKQLAV
jgi:hypothetical protein